MARRDHRWMDPRLNRAVVVLGDRQQLDRVAEFARVVDVGERDTADTLGMDLLRFNHYTEGERDEQTELVRGIMAFDIEGWIGLGQAVALRLFESVGKLRAPF